jgi:hypothetical protein
MTELLEEAIHRLRQLPDTMQNNAAHALLLQLEEEPEPSDFATREQLRHENGLGDS